MHRQLLICSVILSSSLVHGATFGQNPTHVCPQWEWGQTGDIHHYYSQYCEDSGGCVSLGWDNYDGGPNLAMNVGCPPCSNCLSLLLLTSQTKQTPETEQGKEKESPRTTNKGRRPQTDPQIANKGLNNLLPPGFRPNTGPGASLRDTLKADVEIKPGKTIRVNLFLVLLNPKGHGHIPGNNPTASAPALVANGVEVERLGNADIHVPNVNVAPGGGDNAFDVTVGQIIYRVITHDE